MPYLDGNGLKTLWSQSKQAFALGTHKHTKSDITDFPTLATVATSGKYSDLTNAPDEAAMTSATENANNAADAAYLAASSAVSGTLEATMSAISKMVQNKTADKVFPLGSQLPTVLNDNSGNVYVSQFAWDVVHHFNGSDDAHPLVTLESGEQVPGMMVMAHRTLPWSIPFEPKQAAIIVTGAMGADTYHFTVKINSTWGSGAYSATGSRTYQFTTTNALTAGAQLVFSGDPYNTQLTAMNLTVYNASGTQVESCAITEASGGTDLGTMNDSTPSSNTQTYAKLNNPERATYGSNRWATSQLRAVLNTNGTVVQGGTEFSRPWSTSWVGQKGILARLPEDFVSVLGKVARTQELHPWDGKGYDSTDNYLETTYDYLFPISAREHYFANYLAATTAGYNAEGVVLDYWKALAQASGRTSPWAGWTTYPELITYDSKATTTARSMWLRAARRSTSYAGSVGCVSTSGGVSHGSALSGYYAAPACVIV